MSALGLLYCRACDLAFCAKHTGAHPASCRGTPVPDDRAQFCSVCVGLYRPASE